MIALFFMLSPRSVSPTEQLTRVSRQLLTLCRIQGELPNGICLYMP